MSTEQTLSIIKPDAVSSNHIGEILTRFEKAGLKISGRSQDNLVELIEIPNHSWFIGCQFHPEFTSTPRDGHPLFTGFIQAARNATVSQQQTNSRLGLVKK